MTRLSIPLVALLLAPACADRGDTGTAIVFVIPEDSITGGLDPGSSNEDIRDGWAVRYTKFLSVIGNVRASRSDTGESVRDNRAYVVDLRHSPSSGYAFATLTGLSAGRWDRFGIDVLNASAGTPPLPPATADDAAWMAQGGYALYFEGTMTNDAGQSCTPGSTPRQCVPEATVAFRWGLPAGTSYDQCSTPDGLPGFAVPSGGSVEIKPTIHGDHWFFSNVTSGAEITERLAQFVADCDLDHDGETTLDELRNVRAADVLPATAYNLSGATGGPIVTAYDYVLAEARTVTDYQGDGMCPQRTVLP